MLVAPVLVLAPTGRDAMEIARVLGGIDVATRIMTNVVALCSALQGDGLAEIAALFITEEALAGGSERLRALLADQPPWSDIPIVILTVASGQRGSWERWALFEGLGNVTLLSRPMPAQALHSAARAALRARARQRETRQHLEALQQSAETLETRVQERTSALMLIEERLHQAQKMEAVGQLTGGLAHDFNNMLTGVIGSLELMDKYIGQQRFTRLDRYVRAARAEAQRAAALTHRLLAFSRRQALDSRPTDIHRLIAGMEELIRRTMGPAIAITVAGACGLWNTMVDPNQLESALLNLCINARDAMPDGGRLTIATANVSLDAPTARQHDIAPGDYVTISVTDTGAGMPPEVMARAFDPFFTTKPIGQGTGLGLSMIYGFSQQSGGKVTLRSAVGHGTTVLIYLPRHDGEATIEESPTGIAEPQAQATGTVLVVDDEPMVRTLVAETLADRGYTIIEAADGTSGLQSLRSDARIDLLISDIGLPGGINGRQMADLAREVRPELKVLFITGYAEETAVGAGHLRPGMHVLAKPFAMQALASKVNAILGRG